jgi:hypothetical protein
MSDKKAPIRQRVRRPTPSGEQRPNDPLAAAAPASPSLPHTSRGQAKAKRTRKQPTGNYEVGYCKPPTSGRFPNAHSNRQGRPRGAKNLATCVRKELDVDVTFTDKGEPRTMSCRELIARQIVREGAKINPKAIDIIVKIDTPPDERGASGNARAPSLTTTQTEARTELLPDEQAVWDELMTMALEAAQLKGAQDAGPRGEEEL